MPSARIRDLSEDITGLIQDAAEEIRQELAHGATTGKSINVRGKVVKNLRRLFKAGLDYHERVMGSAQRPDTETLKTWVNATADTFQDRTKPMRSTKRQSNFSGLRTEALKEFDRAFKMGWSYAAGDPEVHAAAGRSVAEKLEVEIPKKYYDIFMGFCQWSIMMLKEHDTYVIFEIPGRHGMAALYKTYIGTSVDGKLSYAEDKEFPIKLSDGFMRAMRERGLIEPVIEGRQGLFLSGLGIETYMNALVRDAQKDMDFILSPAGRRRAMEYPSRTNPGETAEDRVERRRKQFFEDFAEFKGFLAKFRGYTEEAAPAS